MSRIIGCSIENRLSSEQKRRMDDIQNEILNYFPWLQRYSMRIGETILSFWGHGEISDRLHMLQDGTLLVLVGSPVGDINWSTIERDLIETETGEEIISRWDGRFVLLKISSNGDEWTMWNDWNGSIPVFHTQVGVSRIASTLEPIVVGTAGYTPDNFFIPGLVSLLINGHYLGEWTLFDGMYVIPPDCIAEWKNLGFRWRRHWTVKPSSERWNSSWDDLIDEMYELSHQAIRDVLETERSWILPLSGGLDSRMIAAVGTQLGVDIYAYTYGHADWVETIYARQVAQRLKLPWQRVPIEPDYLVRFTPMWLDWFGSALHCHGMYQMPFLVHLDTQPPGPILQGYMGDPLAGNHIIGLVDTHRQKHEVNPVTHGGTHWLPEDIEKLVSIPSIQDFLEEIKVKTDQEIKQTSGDWYQQLMLLDFWNRQRLFVYYQPMMYDYYRGVATPFLNKKYAQFCLSLPRHALENRRLQKQMLCRYYPSMAAIGGTYGRTLIRTKSYWMKKTVSRILPRSLRKGTLEEFGARGNLIQTNALISTGYDSLWPLNEARGSLGDYFDLDVIEKKYQQAAAGDEAAYNSLRPIQPIAWHYLRTEAG